MILNWNAHIKGTIDVGDRDFIEVVKWLDGHNEAFVIKGYAVEYIIVDSMNVANPGPQEDFGDTP